MAEPDRTNLGIDASPQRLDRRHAADADRTYECVIAAGRLLADLHCEDIVALDLRGLSDVTDYILIASGTSDRQILAVARDVEGLAGQYNLQRFGREVDAPTTWLIADFVDLVIHLFEPSTRSHYDLEMMWGDAPKVDWQRRAAGGEGDDR